MSVSPLRPVTASGTQASEGRAAGEDEFEEIVYHLTHDVRAMLRAVTILPGWIEEELKGAGVCIPEGAQQSLEMLRTQGLRADQLMLDLRTYSRVGRMSDPRTEVSIRDALRASAKQLTIPAGFQVGMKLDLPTVNAPRNDLVTAFEAMLSNAIKHHHSDKGRVFVCAERDRGSIVISVEDDGPGIEPKFRERVVKLLTTLKPRDECEGSGVGLAIAAKIARLLGGSLAVTDPRHLSGCRVEMQLPES